MEKIKEREQITREQLKAYRKDIITLDNNEKAIALIDRYLNYLDLEETSRTKKEASEKFGLSVNRIHQIRSKLRRMYNNYYFNRNDSKRVKTEKKEEVTSKSESIFKELNIGTYNADENLLYFYLIRHRKQFPKYKLCITSKEPTRDKNRNEHSGLYTVHLEKITGKTEHIREDNLFELGTITDFERENKIIDENPSLKDINIGDLVFFDKVLTKSSRLTPVLILKELPNKSYLVLTTLYQTKVIKTQFNNPSYIIKSVLNPDEVENDLSIIEDILNFNSVSNKDFVPLEIKEETLDLYLTEVEKDTELVREYIKFSKTKDIDEIASIIGVDKSTLIKVIKRVEKQCTLYIEKD